MQEETSWPLRDTCCTSLMSVVKNRCTWFCSKPSTKLSSLQKQNLLTWRPGEERRDDFRTNRLHHWAVPDWGLSWCPITVMPGAANDAGPLLLLLAVWDHQDDVKQKWFIGVFLQETFIHSLKSLKNKPCKIYMPMKLIWLPVFQYISNIEIYPIWINLQLKNAT